MREAVSPSPQQAPFEVGWGETLEPHWLDFGRGEPARILIKSTRTENRRNSRDPDGLFFVERTFITHHMETLLVAGGHPKQFSDLRELLAEGPHPSLSINLSDESQASGQSDRIGSPADRRFEVDHIDYGAIEVIGQKEDWTTGRIAIVRRSSITPNLATAHLNISMRGRNIDIPPEKFELGWASIGAYVEGRRALLM